VSPSSTSTVIFTWAALIVLWAVIFIFHRRLRADLLELRLTQISAQLRSLVVSAGPVGLPEMGRLEAAIQTGLQLSELWSGSLLLMVRGRSSPIALYTPVPQLGAEIGRVIATHIACGCPLLWPMLFNKSWLHKIETMVIAICFTPKAGELQ
jgi:hypothetical protein